MILSLLLLLQSLLSDVAFGIGCWYFASFEQSGIGAQWSNFAVSPKDGDTYSLLGCILMMLFDAVLYLILTWYIETVFPGGIQNDLFHLRKTVTKIHICFISLKDNMVYPNLGILCSSHLTGVQQSVAKMLSTFQTCQFIQV